MADTAQRAKLYWDSRKKEVVLPLDVLAHTIDVRIPQDVLEAAEDNQRDEPVRRASRHFDMFLDAAINKVCRQEYEDDGSILLRIRDLPGPSERRNINRPLGSLALWQTLRHRH